MCGIVGIALIGDDHPTENSYNAALKIAAEALHHRGPDDMGIYVDSKVNLVHKRLSIVDLSEAGRQPFNKGANGFKVVAAVNGEIYNYKELRKKLLRKGAKFVSNSDCEIIPVGYEIDGKSFFSKLEGMFAFVLYCSKLNSIFLGRDPRGKKPLFYTIDTNRLLFGSEIKALKPIVKQGFDISWEGLNLFLKLRYVPSPYTIYKDIFKLRPGELIQVKLSSGRITYHRNYCGSLTFQHNSSAFQSKAEIRNTLVQAISKRLMGDVPVGILLSGGIDSGLLAFLIRNELGYRLHAYTLKFNNRETDETRLAKMVAKQNGHWIKEVEVPSGKALVKFYRKFCLHLDQPDTNLANVGIALLCKKAHEDGLKVLLSGDGADEIFFGYSRYKQKIIRKPFQCLKRNWGLKNYINEKQKSIGLSEYTLAGPWQQEPDLGPIDYIRSLNNNNPSIRNQAIIDNEMWVPEQANMRSDFNGMRYSIEIRCPYEDLQLQHIVSQLSILANYVAFKPKLTFGPKTLLRKIAFNNLPRKCLQRKKTGFSTILNKKMSEDLRYWKEFLSPLNIRKVGLFDEKKVRNLLEEDRINGKLTNPVIRHILLAQVWFTEHSISLV